MPPRKTVAREAPSHNDTSTAVLVDGPLSLEGEEIAPLAAPEGPSVAGERHARRLQQWKESPFACGFTMPTWKEERERGRHPGDDELMPDTSGCLCCSSLVCPYVGAGRVGNMAVLHMTTEHVERIDTDEETGDERVTRYKRPKIQCVVGPYWPMLLFVTYPLILVVSFLSLTTLLQDKPSVPGLLFVWTLMTVGLIVSLGCTACSDPGILYRIDEPPPQEESLYRWSDQTQTYRPRTAIYDTDTGVVVRGFDHTCPWTGTAIGENNMLPFQTFVCLVFMCLVVSTRTPMPVGDLVTILFVRR